jgi:hypothetical protein
MEPREAYRETFEMAQVRNGDRLVGVRGEEKDSVEEVEMAKLVGIMSVRNEKREASRQITVTKYMTEVVSC